MLNYHVFNLSFIYFTCYIDGMFQSKCSFTGHKGIFSYFTWEPKGTTLNMLVSVCNILLQWAKYRQIHLTNSVLLL